MNLKWYVLLSLLNLSDIVFKFFKSCPLQVLLGPFLPFLNTFSHMISPRTLWQNPTLLEKKIQTVCLVKVIYKVFQNLACYWLPTALKLQQWKKIYKYFFTSCAGNYLGFNVFEPRAKFFFRTLIHAAPICCVYVMHYLIYFYYTV